jgi:pyruvate formate lyase activating enzyme
VTAAGLVTQIVRGSYLDGPGLRTVVFLKGCPLRCGWCHNPETQRREPEVLFDERRCIRCGACVEACPSRATSLDLPGRVDRARCAGDHACARVCPAAALRPAGVEMTLARVMAEIAKDRLFYANSGGGVTFSGGEPLMQVEFLGALLAACREMHLSTALDTCLAVDYGAVELVRPLVDVFLVDLKHATDASVQAERVADNARRLAASGAALWLRVPVIPGWNDHREAMESLARLAASLGGHVESAHLLPFEGSAEVKYRYLGREWPYRPTQEISAEKLEEFRRLFALQGLRTVLGGAPAPAA